MKRQFRLCGHDGTIIDVENKNWSSRRGDSLIIYAAWRLLNYLSFYLWLIYSSFIASNCNIFFSPLYMKFVLVCEEQPSRLDMREGLWTWFVFIPITRSLALRRNNREKKLLWEFAGEIKNLQRWLLTECELQSIGRFINKLQSQSHAEFRQTKSYIAGCDKLDFDKFAQIFFSCCVNHSWHRLQ